MGEPEVVARRFDQLGGRLGTLCNAIAVADLLGLQFGLIWPYSQDDAINDPAQLFAPSFLADHQLRESDLDDRTAIPCESVPETLRERARQLTTNPQRPPFIDIPGPFELLTAQVEDEHQAQTRFRRAFSEVQWAEPLQPVIEFCSTWTRGQRWTGIHIRAGDTIVGPWQNGMWHEKYLPTSCLDAALAECEREDSPVLLCSDHPQYAAWLRSHHAGISTANEVLPNLDVLPPVQRAFAEILLLSTCERILGPPRSAFSGLAAMLGCGAVTRCDELCPESTGPAPIEASITAMEAAGADRIYLLPFVARDTCWWSDVYADQIGAREILPMLRRATRADPGFAAAWARRARSAARMGRTIEARRATRRALTLAAADRRHDDPIVDALAARVVCEVCRVMDPFRWAFPRRATRCLRLASDAVDDCRIRQPFVIHISKVTADLDALVVAARQLAALPLRRRLSAAWRLRSSLRRPFAHDEFGSRSESGKRRMLHQSVNSFDPVQLDVESILGQFTAALDQSLRSRRSRPDRTDHPLPTSDPGSPTTNLGP